MISNIVNDALFKYETLLLTPCIYNKTPARFIHIHDIIYICWNEYIDSFIDSAIFDSRFRRKLFESLESKKKRTTMRRDIIPAKLQGS